MEELVEYDAIKVAKHYIKTWFIPDLISALPMDLLLNLNVKTNIYIYIVTIKPFHFIP